MRPSQIKTLLKNIKFSPKKLWGQNFLINENVAKDLLDAASIQYKDTVLEIGPGLGFITEKLLKKCQRVIAIEIDKDLCNYLEAKFRDQNNLKIINKDVLQIDLKSLNLKKYKVVGSLPYTGSLKIIRKFLEEKIQPESITVIIQKEVAQKISSNKMSLPKAAIDLYAQTKIIKHLSRDFFYPKPKVEGTILHIFNIHKPDSSIDLKLLFKILKTGFLSPRKTLLNNLSKGFNLKKEIVRKILSQNKINPYCRAENLSLQDWINLSFAFKKFYGTIIKENGSKK